MPKKSEKTFSGSPKEGEQGGSPRCYIYKLYPSPGTYIAWSLTEGRPHFAHGQQFRECAVSLRFLRVVIPDCEAFASSGWRVCPAASCPPVSILKELWRKVQWAIVQTLHIPSKKLHANAIIPALQAEICLMFHL